MRMRISLLAALLCAAPACAAEQTKYLTYPVTGNTAAAIYANIKSSAPRVVANATFAFMAIATKTVKREAKAKTTCRYSAFKTSAIYYITLPRLTKSPGAVGGKFRAFAGYLKSHEEWHRDNWRGCLKDYDREALSLAARDCKALDRKREKLFTSIKRTCIAKDEAFDFSFRKDVLKHPFVVEATRKN